jgi:hypothetical protein
MQEAEALEHISFYNSQIKQLYVRTMMGDELAAGVLVEYASVAIQALEQVARREPERLHQMSMHHIRWPGFIGTREIQKERNQILIAKLKLGEKSPLRGRWNPKSPATFTAYSMLYWLSENQSALQLPPFSKSCYDQWFEMGWRGFSERLQGRPETYPYLGHLFEKSAILTIEKKQEKRNLDTVIREMMKKAVKQGFASVTKNHLS